MEVHSPSGGVVPEPVRRLFGSQTGLVPELYVTLVERDDPDVVLTQLRDSGVRELFDRDHRTPLQAAGKGRDVTSSFMSCVGETVERYCLYWPDYDAILEATHDELRDRGRNVVPYDYLDVYPTPERATDDVPEFTPSSRIQWVPGKNLLTGETVYVPAELVYLGVEPPPSCSKHFPPTSNGAACGWTVKSALVGSIYESVERHAMMRSWLLESTPSRISIESVADVEGTSPDDFGNDFVDYHLFRYDTDLDFTTLGCAAVDCRDRTPKFVMGASASLSPTDATVDALLEAAQGRVLVKELRTRYQKDGGRGMEDLMENVYSYSKAENFDRVRFLLDGPTENMSLDEPAYDDELHACLDRLDRASVTPVAFDLTTPDVEDVGLAVTKVVIPELLPFSPPRVLPLEHPAVADEATNCQPHPFP